MGIKAGSTKESNTNPQRVMKSKIMKSHWSPTRPAKLFFQNQFGNFQTLNQGKQRNANSGLCNCEVCKDASWHNVFNFLTLNLRNDSGFCTMELINKVFDFKIYHALCFLLINYNGNEPNIS